MFRKNGIVGMNMKKILDMIKFDDKGLVPAVVQDCKTGKLLMLAYMNRESLEKTITTGETWFYSRSRQKLWHKGESSGHIQKVEEIRIDCDLDTLLLAVEQTSAACHTGYYTCFYRRLNSAGDLEVIEEKVFEP